MTTPYYTITARGHAAADLHIYGQIGDSVFAESVTARALVAELAETGMVWRFRAL